MELAHELTTGWDQKLTLEKETRAAKKEGCLAACSRRNRETNILQGDFKGPGNSLRSRLSFLLTWGNVPAT